MNHQRHKQFMLESKMIEDSSELAVENAHRLNEEYLQMSAEEMALHGECLVNEMIYWECRLRLEDRIMRDHLKKYKDLIFEDPFL